MIYLVKILTFLFLVQIQVHTGETSRILAVYPIPSISHQVVFRSLMQELAKRGHEVVVITPYPAFPNDKRPPNLIEIDVHNISYHIWNTAKKTATGVQSDYTKQIKIIYEKASALVETQFKSSEIQSLVNNKQKTFDLVFLELCTRLTLGYSYIYKVPVVQFSSLGGVSGTYETMGALSHYYYYPLPFEQRFRSLSMWERLLNLYKYCVRYVMYTSSEDFDNLKLKISFGENIPMMSKLRENVNMVFMNSHSLWDLNRPISRNIIRLHGIHVTPNNKLNEDLENFLSNSTHGAIYMSLGTNSYPSTLPQEKINIFINVFSELPYNILLKWDLEELPNCPQNVKVSKWVPQTDVLGHRNIKLFITQAGLQSTDESIFAGIPLIAIPLFADQWFNAEMYEIYKIGLKLDMETLTYDVFKNSIETVINDLSYRNNIVRLRSIMQDHAQTALERAVWWTEHVLQHGGAHIRPPAANMSWTEYYEFELVFIVISTLTSVVIAISFLIGHLISKIKRKLNSFYRYYSKVSNKIN